MMKISIMEGQQKYNKVKMIEDDKMMTKDYKRRIKDDRKIIKTE